MTHPKPAMSRRHPTSRSKWRPALLVSLAVHAVLLLAMVWYAPRDWFARADLAGEVAEAPTPAERPESPPAPRPERSPPADEVPPDQVQESVESQIQRAAELPAERQLTELERNLERLEGISNEESVQAVSETIAGAMGIDSDQYAPRETPAPGPIDADTAQIETVARESDDAGGFRYEAVLIDQEGRTLTVPLTEAEGERLYRTFETIKRYPFAEGIYRQLVMPIVQRMLKAEGVVEPPGAKPPQEPFEENPVDH